MKYKGDPRDTKYITMTIVVEAIGESFRHTRLWHVWREVPEKQKNKIEDKWTVNLLALNARLNGKTPVKKKLQVLIEEIEEDLKRRGGIGRVWHDLKESEQKSLRRKWRGIFLKNLYPPESETPAKEETNDETKLDAPGNGDSQETIPPVELAGTPASPAALEQTSVAH